MATPMISPNHLTYLRMLLCIPFVGAFYFGETGRTVAFWLFLTAGITDFLDGWLARRTNSESTLGALLDPIADKIMVAVALAMLLSFGEIEGFHTLAAALILAREFAVAGLREHLSKTGLLLPVAQIAKLKTLLQVCALAALVAPITVIHNIGIELLWAAALVTVWSGYAYFQDGIQRLRERP